MAPSPSGIGNRNGGAGGMDATNWRILDASMKLIDEVLDDPSLSLTERTVLMRVRRVREFSMRLLASVEASELGPTG